MSSAFVSFCFTSKFTLSIIIQFKFPAPSPPLQPPSWYPHNSNYGLINSITNKLTHSLTLNSKNSKNSFLFFNVFLREVGSLHRYQYKYTFFIPPCSKLSHFDPPSCFLILKKNDLIPFHSPRCFVDTGCLETADETHPFSCTRFPDLFQLIFHLSQSITLYPRLYSSTILPLHLELEVGFWLDKNRI